MVWRSNFLIDGKPVTFDNFLLNIDYFGSLNPFFPLAYFKDQKDVFKVGQYLPEDRFPSDITFGNFQCLRCGLCCKNWSGIQVSSEAFSKWRRNPKIRRYLDEDLKELCAYSEHCHFCRKVPKKVYYNCTINSEKEHIFDCRVYLCQKSLPVAHLQFNGIEDLIQLIGLPEYYSLIERDWNDVFDFSKCFVKTHKKRKQQPSYLAKA
jgi:hypothetical protein